VAKSAQLTERDDANAQSAAASVVLMLRHAARAERFICPLNGPPPALI
jgi:hypothetical protein